MIHRAMIPVSRGAMIPVIVAVLTAVSFLPALSGSFVARRRLAAAIGDGAQSDRHERSLGEDAAGPSWSRRMAPERVLQPGPRP
jgi:hypothetical protein